MTEIKTEDTPNEEPVANGSSWSVWYRAHRAAGLCGKCSRPAEEGKSLCARHRELERIYSRDVAVRRQQAGLCLAKGCTRSVEKPSNSYCAAHRNRARACNRKRLQRIKREVLAHYGDSRCACCGETRLEFLTIDHIFGGGRQHRQSQRIGNMCVWLKKHNFPEGYQVLCMNCNFAKGRFGRCPHEIEAEASSITPQSPMSATATSTTIETGAA